MRPLTTGESAESTVSCGRTWRPCFECPQGRSARPVGPRPAAATRQKRQGRLQRHPRPLRHRTAATTSGPFAAASRSTAVCWQLPSVPRCSGVAAWCRTICQPGCVSGRIIMGHQWALHNRPGQPIHICRWPQCDKCRAAIRPAPGSAGLYAVCQHSDPRGALAGFMPHAGRNTYRATRFCFRKWPVTRRPSLAGFERPLTGLSDEFAADAAKQRQWVAFLRRSRLADASPPLEDVVAKMREFLSAPLEACAKGSSFDAAWPPDGPWTSRT